MLTNIVTERFRRWGELYVWTQAAHHERQCHHDDHKARDPDQSDGSLIAELIAESVAEVDEVQHDHDRYQSDLEARFMATVERQHGWSTSGHVINDETSGDTAIVVVVVVVVVGVFCFL